MFKDFFNAFSFTDKGNAHTCHICKQEYRIPQNKRKEWSKLHYPCPYCGETYSIRNKGERELFRLQDEFFDNLGDKRKLDSILTKMYGILEYYTQSLIKSKFANIENIPLTIDVLLDKSSLASTYTITKYSKDYKYYLRPDFLTKHMDKYFSFLDLIDEDNDPLINFQLSMLARKSFRIPFMINLSFSSYQIKAALVDAFFSKEFYEIQGKREGTKKGVVKEVVSIDQMFESERGEGGPVFPVYEYDGRIQEIERKEASDTLLNTLIDLIEGIGDKLHPSDDLIRLMVLKHYLNGKEVYAEKLFRLYGRHGKQVYMQTIDILKQYLKERLF